MLNICSINILSIEISNNEKSKLIINKRKGKKRETAKKREAAKRTRRQERDIFCHREKVRGIINTILRAPGCFLSPKNVFTKIWGGGGIEKVERRSV